MSGRPVASDPPIVPRPPCLALGSVVVYLLARMYQPDGGYLLFGGEALISEEEL